ncbi:lysosome membrane protein 2-like [Liolophura sinensis]|uniref:lysosome membrane protein 2-like n=1 Tax=Liolophura sinensis TaxID=3198878 RepID=UPI00315826D4
MGRRAVVCATLTGVIGLAFLVTGAVLIPVLKNITVHKVDDTIPITEGSVTYDAWKTPSDSAPIYFQTYLFDLVNHEEVILEGKKPILQQKGPYTYQEKRKKVNITFHDNGTVSYRELHYYIFDREMSVGDENDTFTTINLPMVTLANMLRFEYDVILQGLQALFTTVGENLFLELSVADILWGYEDNLLKEAKHILADYNLTFPIDDKFGLFYKQNTSDDGEYMIYTGQSDLRNFAYIESWNGKSTLDFWTTDQANQINGTAGTMYPPFVKKEDILYLFSSDIGRSVYGTYTQDQNLYDIELLRFVPPKAVFENHTLNPANTGFCVPVGTCLDSGVLNISVFKQGAPVVMSQPHFLAGAQKYISGVEGMHPNQEEHQTFFDVEPTTGVVMNVAKRLQVNVYLQHIPFITDLEKITKPILFPVVWVNESATITQKTASAFKKQVQDPMKLTKALEYTLIIVGVAMIIFVLAYFIRKAISKFNQPVKKELNHVEDVRDTTNLVTE